MRSINENVYQNIDKMVMGTIVYKHKDRNKTGKKHLEPEEIE